MSRCSKDGVEVPPVWPPLTALLPHRPPMLWIDRIVAWSKESVACEATIGANHPLIASQGVPVVVTLEQIAQTAGVYLGLQAHGRGQTMTGGMLLGVREMQFYVDHVDVDDVLQICARPIWTHGRHVRFTGEVRRLDATVATATLDVTCDYGCL